jgi:hypothetical protein
MGPPPAAISNVIDRISAASAILASNPTDPSNRTQIHSLAVELVGLTQDPFSTLRAIAFMPARSAALITAFNLDVLSHIPVAGSKTASELAAAVNCEEQLLVRILRPLCASGCMREAGPEVYARTPLTHMLCMPELQALIRHQWVHTMPILAKLPKFYAQNGYRSPQSLTDTAFQFAHGTDETIFAFMDKRPEMRDLFNKAMTTKSATVQVAVAAYPFDKELSVSEGEVALVDVGGGRGHVIREIQRQYPDLKGKFVLEDLASSIESGIEVDQSVQVQTYDFFQDGPNPVKGARAYMFCNVLHDFSDPLCRTILSNTVAAMSKDSKILIVETVVPNERAPLWAGLLDINMMSMGGIERSERMWVDLLESAGLKVNKVWKAKAGLFGVVEAVLKD